MNDLNPTRPVRPGEEINTERLADFLKTNLPGFENLGKIGQFAGGFSNLTYSVSTNLGPFVLRRPPIGAAIKGGHDMGREFRMLAALHPFFEKTPRPILACDDESVIGSPFFLMEKMEGQIFRKPADVAHFQPKTMENLSISTACLLAELHAIDVSKPELAALGKPEGYVARQVEGWTTRYEKAKTDNLPAMRKLADFLQNHQPPVLSPPPSEGAGGRLIHNDFKFDNLIFQEKEGDFEPKAILDWEMATLGDPLMDLGTTLGYWFEAGEEMPGFSGPTTAAGNLSRREFADFYGEKTGRSLDWIVFYYGFGLFKIAVIAQQIYARWKAGLTRDPRFGMLGQVVEMLGTRGWQAVRKERV